MATFRDDSSDDETLYLPLTERLRIYKGNLATNAMNGKEKKLLFGEQSSSSSSFKQTSSSSSFNMQNDSILPGPISAHSLHNKKRQNGDTPLSRKIMDFSSETLNSTCLSDKVTLSFPDKTYKDHLSMAKPTKACNLIQVDSEDLDIDIWTSQNKKPTAKNVDPLNPAFLEMPLPRSQNALLIDSASDSRLMRNAALKGGSQSLCHTSLKRVCDSDNTESVDGPTDFSASSLDSEDSKPFVRLKKKPRTVQIDNLSQKSTYLSFSSCDSQQSELNRRSGESSSFFDNNFVNYLPSPCTNYPTPSPSYDSYKTHYSYRANRQPVTTSDTVERNGENLRNTERLMPPTPSRSPNQRRTVHSYQHLDMELVPDSAQQQNSDTDAGCWAHHLPDFLSMPTFERRFFKQPKPTHGASSRKLADTSAAASGPFFGRAEPKPNLAASNPYIFHEADSSKISSAFSGKVSDSKAFSNTVLDLLASQRVPHSPVPAAPSVNVFSGGNDISIVYSIGPNLPSQPHQSRIGASGTSGSGNNRRPHSRNVSPSPEPVNQVIQDERFAKELQALYDAEVDPTPHPYLSGSEILPQQNLNARVDTSRPQYRRMSDEQPLLNPLHNIRPSYLFPPREDNHYESFLEPADQIHDGIGGIQTSQINKLPVRRRIPTSLYSPMNSASTSNADALQNSQRLSTRSYSPMNSASTSSAGALQINKLPTREYSPMSGASISSAAALRINRLSTREYSPMNGASTSNAAALQINKLPTREYSSMSGASTSNAAALQINKLPTREYSAMSRVSKSSAAALRINRLSTREYSPMNGASASNAAALRINRLSTREYSPMNGASTSNAAALQINKLPTREYSAMSRASKSSAAALRINRLSTREYSPMNGASASNAAALRINRLSTREYSAMSGASASNAATQIPRWMTNQQPHAFNTRLSYLFPPRDNNHYEAYLGFADNIHDEILGSQTSQTNRLLANQYSPMNSASTSNAAAALQNSQNIRLSTRRYSPINGASTSSAAALQISKLHTREYSPMNDASTSSAAELNKECQIEFHRDEYENDYNALVALNDIPLVKNDEQFECAVCFMEVAPKEGVVLRECLHSFCRECLSGSIEHSDTVTVKCPFANEEYSCKSHLQDREIKHLVTPEMYEKHLARSLMLAESQARNSSHCKTPDCPGWCLFEDNVNTFLCPVCKKTNCLTCGAIHEGRNCRQYQEWLELQSDTSEEARETRDYLRNMVTSSKAMQCPRCQVILMKKLGCDALNCTMCHLQLCWATKGPRWGPRGVGDISGGCKCMLNGIRCHPMCTTCH